MQSFINIIFAIWLLNLSIRVSKIIDFLKFEIQTIEKTICKYFDEVNRNVK